MDSYPILNFLVEHGRKLALALGALALIFGIIGALEQGTWSWIVGGAIGGVLIYGFVASYAELVRLVTDMLLPK